MFSAEHQLLHHLLELQFEFTLYCKFFYIFFFIIIVYNLTLLYENGQFKNIRKIGRGRFNKIYKTTWINSLSYQNEKKEDFEYKDSITITLKQLNNSENITLKELNEV